MNPQDLINIESVFPLLGLSFEVFRKGGLAGLRTLPKLQGQSLHCLEI
jgi:hypothetical protein